MRPSAADQSFNIYAVTTDGTSKVLPLVTTPYLDIQPAISPDGKWVAYSSLESGQNEVYVQGFPEPGERRRISAQGGVQPLWRGDGRELFYLNTDRSLMSVAVTPGSPPRYSLPVKLMDAPVVPRPITRNLYVPSRDGQRFLMVTPAGDTRVAATTVVLDWLAGHEGK
jgi:Tol biopolymer transport system component